MAGSIISRELPALEEPEPCSFGKALLAGCCSCSLMSHFYIAEREILVCRNESAHDSCRELHDLLSHNSAFALKRIHEDQPVTHAQEMKVQCGGLRGLYLALNESGKTCNVSAMVQAAVQEFGGLENLPYSSIVQSVASFKMRRRNDRS